MATALVQSNISVALLVSPDPSFRERLRSSLSGLRWEVRETSGGAEALRVLRDEQFDAVLLDSWLPDLDIEEFAREVTVHHPRVDLVAVDGTLTATGGHRPRRGELLHALRTSQDATSTGSSPVAGKTRALASAARQASPAVVGLRVASGSGVAVGEPAPPNANANDDDRVRLPELIGSNPAMLDVSRRIRLVAPRKTSVLIQGPTGTGKELVARALHRLSPRAHRPFVALNCAAIPESLLEAELFGHARGAFTGAVQRRVGRIEAADGGTLFLDEIGEMPLPLQSKLLRFLESGELQRVGENENVHVDVRVVSATHQPLAARAKEASFRADLYYRLAVFFINTPSLSERPGDLPLLAEHFLRRIAENNPAKVLTQEALQALQSHDWPGNVRELEHVVERAYILAEDRFEITAKDVEFGQAF